MKQGRSRTMSICVSDIPKERLLRHGNGKVYLLLSTFDYDEPDRFDNDFSISMQQTPQEIERKSKGEKVDRIFLGSGRIWEQKSKMKPYSEDKDNEADPLPF